ncbi:FecR domain-containing protein [Piscinibacter sp. XHJ-5]|uniref:FecR domain-containing protein n=1 Tax=Piscinibacter sp. XHJ-5 TaxID=3037797 RepID=UPI0024529B6C|nr:FecR domain-containing protein [Piscinibacter sp. XHJ-5]
MMRAFILAAVLTAPWSVHAADVSGTITILEGEAVIYRGAGRVHAAEGVRLMPGDIVETAASTFTQIELADQSVAQFGPATRAMFNVSTSKQKTDRWLYLMDGWVKLIGAKRDAPAAAPGFDLRAPLIEMPASAAAVVLRSSPSEVSLFVEKGETRVAERQQGAPVVVLLKAGDFFRRKAGTRGSVSASPAPAFVAEMPKFFRDSLPLRLERYRDRPVQPKDAPDFVYADVEHWLKAESSVRRPLMQRWRGKAREAAFRNSLVANLSAHPEWDPILFPEKYKPKEPPAPPKATVVTGRPPTPAASSVAN